MPRVADEGPTGRSPYRPGAQYDRAGTRPWRQWADNQALAVWAVPHQVEGERHALAQQWDQKLERRHAEAAEGPRRLRQRRGEVARPFPKGEQDRCSSHDHCQHAGADIRSLHAATSAAYAMPPPDASQCAILPKCDRNLTKL